MLLSDDVILVAAVRLDMLALIGAAVVLLLTAICMTFGIEYMTREAFAYNVLVTLVAFSASIV